MGTWQESIAAMQAEWHVLCDRLRADVAQWEQAIVDLAEEEGRLRDEGRWVHGRDDYLGVLERQRDELAHSRLLGWLLDPSARHGLGSRVRRGVLRRLSPTEYSGLDRARVACEQQLANGRLDIVVTAPGLLLVIENKVDAAEGEDQCAYYSGHLPEDAVCILLSPEGRGSRTASTFVPLCYAEFADLVEAALSDAPSTIATTAGRRVAEDYLLTLRREFPWPSPTSASSSI